MDRLHGEGARDELSGQPLEKIRMRRLSAPDPEVVLRLDEAEAKKPLPPAVDGCVACDYYQEEPLTPRMFSFNSHVGACPACAGLGKSEQIDPQWLVPFPEYPLFGGALVTGRLGSALARRNGKIERALRAFAEREGIDLGRPFGELAEDDRRRLLHGDGRTLRYRRRRGFSRGYRTVDERFDGLVGLVERWFGNGRRADWLEPVLADVTCPACEGERLRPEYRAVTIGGRNISRFCGLTVEEAAEAVGRWKLSANDRKVAEQPLQEIRSRLGFLRDVGLVYLTLNRQSATLSGGEAQRIRLASQIGSFLVGVLYVLDEPTIGLHPRDTGRLLETLKRLRGLA